MALTVAELNTRLTADVNGLQRGLDKAQKDVNRFTAGTSKAIKGMATAFAARELVQGVGSLINAASDLSETVNKTNEVFGQSSARIQAWAQNAATSMGLSRQAALEAASSFGNMFDQLGFTSDQAATMSTSIVQLAADFGSFHNADITQIINAQSSAFRGEYDALQRFLPLISDAAIKTRALEITGKKNESSLTAQEKALAAYALMFEGAGAAQGDFARTSDSAANQAKTLKGQLDDLKAELGEGLLPAFTSIVAFINNSAIPAFKELFGVGNREGKGFFAKINDAITDTVGFIAAVPQQIGNVAAAVTDAIGADGVAANFRDASNAVGEFRDKMHVSQEELAAAADTTRDFGRATQGSTKAQKDATKATEDQTGAVKDLKEAQVDLKDAQIDLKDAQMDAAEAQEELNELIATGGVDMDKLADATENYARANERLGDATERADEALEDYNEALAEAQDQHLRETRRATDDLADAQKRLRKETQDVTDAQGKLAKLKAQKKARDDAIKAARAQLAAADTVTERTIAQRALDKALGMTIVTDEEIAAAAADVAVQQEDVKDATKDVIQATTDLAAVQAKQPEDYDIVKSAGRRLEDAQEDLAEATEDAKSAQNALNEAQNPAPDFATKVAEKQWEVEKANWAVEKATTAVAKAQNEYNAALNNKPKSITTVINEVTNKTTNETLNKKVNVTMSGLLVNPPAGNMQPMAPGPKIGPSGPLTPGQWDFILGGLGTFHDGGVVPGPRGADVPIMAQAGERVLPLDGSMGGMSITITVAGDVVGGSPGEIAAKLQELLLAHQRRTGPLGFRSN